jgi:hypothetical protein
VEKWKFGLGNKASNTVAVLCGTIAAQKADPNMAYFVALRRAPQSGKMEIRLARQARH